MSTPPTPPAILSCPCGEEWKTKYHGTACPRCGESAAAPPAKLLTENEHAKILSRFPSILDFPSKEKYYNFLRADRAELVRMLREAKVVMQNVHEQLIPALALCVVPEEIHNPKWKECPHCRIEATMGTIQEWLASLPSTL